MPRILIVEDSDDYRNSLAKLLARSGYEVTSAPNGRDALESVFARTPDLVLIDLKMPELDGPSFVEVVRSYLRMHALPVVVLTGIEDGPLIDRIRAQKVPILIKGKATLEDIEAAMKAALVTPTT